MAQTTIRSAQIGDSQVKTADIEDAAVTLAKLADLANQRLIGRNTSGTGVPESITLSQLLDWVGSAANGDILIRSGGSWVRLGIGANGDHLVLSSGLPAWITPSTDPSVGDLFEIRTTFVQNVTRYYPCEGIAGSALTSDPSDSANNILGQATKVQRSGKITSLRAQANAALPASQTAAITLMKNGTATSLTCTLTDAGASASDLSNSVDVAAGDYLSWKAVTSATSSTITLSISANFEPPSSVFTFTKTITLVKDTGLAARNYFMWAAPFACTVTAVKAKRTGGTGATINARKNGASNHLSSNLSLTGTTLTDGGAVQNTAYAAGDELEGMLVSVTGTVTDIVIQVYFTIS